MVVEQLGQEKETMRTPVKFICGQNHPNECTQHLVKEIILIKLPGFCFEAFSARVTLLDLNRSS